MDPTDLVGDVVEQVVASWFQTESGRVEFPIHVWMRFKGHGWVRLHAAGTGELELTLAEPTESYAMGELRGFVVVEDADTGLPVRPLLGHPVSSTVPLLQDPLSEMVGFIVQTTEGAVGFANRADDLLVLPWPAQEWLRWDIRATEA